MSRRFLPRNPAILDWNRFPWPEAITWFARGLGAVHERKPDEVRRAEKRLQELEAAAVKTGEELFSRNIRILHLELKAWGAHMEKDDTASTALMREAAALEESTPKHAVTPGPTLPAQELLGDLFLDQGRSVEALAAYERSLQLYPRRFNSLMGAARAARAAHDDSTARMFYGELLELVDGGGRQFAAQEARAFVLEKK